MLLTGFDVPQAQVLYLDRLIQQAELLQAVARVNRTGSEEVLRADRRLLRRVVANSLRPLLRTPAQMAGSTPTWMGRCAR